jgi:signal transduction histidine kinase
MSNDTPPTQVLLVEDDDGHLELSRRSLLEAENRFSVWVARSLAEAIDAAATRAFDVALIDLGLPDSNGIMTLEAMRSAAPNLPIVVLTSMADERLGTLTLEQGAQDYLIKGVSAELLRRSISYAIQRQQSISENRTLLARLQSANEMLADKNANLQTLFETAQQFVDNVSHEFRTPLTVIREFATIVHDGLAGPVTEQQREYADIIVDRVDDLAIMVDDMLDAGRIEAGMLGIWRRECQVPSIVTHVTRMLERKAQLKNIELATDIPTSLPLVYCDFDKAVRVIVNLTVNAIKFSPEHSTVRIWAQYDVVDGEVTLGVTDTGPGISPENLNRIFARFEQLDKTSVENHKGFGLGLTIARELAELNFGQLHVHSELGKGTTFCCTIPVADPTQVIAHYLRRISAGGALLPTITTISVRAQRCSELDIVPVVDEFLQHTMRCTDLVLRVSGHDWLILAQCPIEEAAKLTGRTDDAWRQYVRNCPIEGLPTLHVAVFGSYALGGELDATVDSLSHDMRSLESAASSIPHILLVDDDPQILLSLSLRLRSEGYDVTSACGGREGIEAAMRSRHDAVLLDMRMPDLDGLSTLAALVQHPQTAATPVIMLSASLRDRQRALDMGARFYLDKPCEPERLSAALNAVMPPDVFSRRRQPTLPLVSNYRPSISAVDQECNPIFASK